MMDMPAKYGSHKTVRERNKNESKRRIWKEIMDSLVSYLWLPQWFDKCR
jgi:hypothetical protein